MHEKKSRCFTVIAYEDDPQFTAIMDAIKNNVPSWAYIRHDKDKNDDMQFKKAHFHFVLYFDNPLNVDGVFRKLGAVCPQNLIQYHDNLKRAIRYLPHLDTPTKYQYPIESVVSNFPLDRYLSQKADEEKEIFRLIDLIETRKITNVYDLVHSGCPWSVIRRNYPILREYISYSIQVAEIAQQGRDRNEAMLQQQLNLAFGERKNDNET